MDILDLGQPPIQAGPRYHCFECGAVAESVQTWSQLPALGGGMATLDEWGDHLAYLVGAPCQCNHRVAKLGAAITPLVFHPRRAFATHAAFVDAEVAALRAALAVIEQAQPAKGVAR